MNLEKKLFYSVELARVEASRSNFYETKIILENVLERFEREKDFLNFPTFFEPEIFDLLSGSRRKCSMFDELIFVSLKNRLIE